MINLKLAVRSLVRSPFVTLVAVISLALGIGANAAIFSLFEQVLLRPLPVHEPGRLVNLSSPGPKPGSQSCNQAGDCDAVFSYSMFRDLEREQGPFVGIAAHRAFVANLAHRGQTLSGRGMLVSGSYFGLLGLQPAAGRLIGPADDRVVGESPVVVLSFEFWRTRFAQRPDVINDTLIVNGNPMTVIGVAPRGFDGTTLGSKPQVFVPITMRGFMQPGFKGYEDRRNYWMYLFARLRPGVALDRARLADQPALSRDPQRRGSAAAEGHERQDDDAVQGADDRSGGGSEGPEPGPWRGRCPADAASRRHRPRAGHRLREHRQPAAGQGRQSRG